MDIKTFAFFDLETTGLPSLEFNNTKITQLSIIACSVDHLMKISNIHDVPRVLYKLSLFFNPMKRISLKSEEITGLSNELLEQERKFDENTIVSLTSFFNTLQQPICLIAHNGSRFDFPIFKTHVNAVGGSFPSSLLCCDSLTVFRKINKIKDQNSRILVNGYIMQSSSTLNDEEIKQMNTEILDIEKYFEAYTSSDDDEEAADNVNPNSTQMLENEFINFISEEDVKARQKENEKTPHKPAGHANQSNLELIQSKSNDENRKRPHSTARRELFPMPADDNKLKKVKFTLREIYFRFFNEYPINSHDAESDVQALLKCACASNKLFVEIVKLNCVYFDNVEELK